MSEANAIILIDANRYLELFRVVEGRKLLAALNEQRQYVFVTKQLVNEVDRNKVEKAAGFFAEQLKRLKLETTGVPDHLFAVGESDVKGMRARLQGIGKEVNELRAALVNHAQEALAKISRSEDEVSKALDKLFKDAKEPTPEEVARAETRKKLGHPPGKSDDPLGDEITWEQFLPATKGKAVWILTEDADYHTPYEKRGYLNAALYRELSAVSGGPVDVHCFVSLAEGLAHFVKTTKVEAKQLPSSEELEKIKAEEEQARVNHLLSHLNSGFPENTWFRAR